MRRVTSTVNLPSRSTVYRRLADVHKRCITSECHVCVVGWGLAGASAALQVSETSGGKARVVVIDRFGGGGASTLSGGVFYAGGTEHQARHGVKDSAENMFKYLKYEVGDSVSAKVLKSFCDTSNENMKWLQNFGAPLGLDGEVMHEKSSYPPDRFTLYFSGSEGAHPFNSEADPAQRGHRASGSGLTGKYIFEALRKATLGAPGITVHTGTKVTGLVEENGNVVGLRVSSLDGAPSYARKLHCLYAALSGNVGIPIGALGWFQRKAQKIEDRHGKEHVIRVNKGVILSTGGFGHNKDLMDKYATNYSGMMPIGTIGDNGSGIQLGLSVGGSVAYMHRCSAWKFLAPNEFMKGIMVSKDGKRVGNEDVYGARIAEAIAEKHDGKAWLIIDQKIWEAAKADMTARPDMYIGYNQFTATMNLHWNRKKATSVDQLAAQYDIDKAGLEDTVRNYNQDVEAGKDSAGKAPHYFQSLSTPPYYAINMSSFGTAWPTIYMTLGGLEVDDDSGLVLRDGNPISGLYAAGRTAKGIPCDSYVSGISLSDCVFSGRRAGRHAGSPTN